MLQKFYELLFITIDNSGAISAAELKKVFDALDINVSKSELKAVMSSMGKYYQVSSLCLKIKIFKKNLFKDKDG